MRRHWQIGVLTAAAMALAACSGGLDKLNPFSSNEKPVNPNLVPAKFKEQILGTIRSMSGDSARFSDSYYSDPAVDPKGAVSVYTSCVRFNIVGGGPAEYAAYYYGGELNQFIKATPGQCSYAAYKPFPELDKLCIGKCS